MAQDSPKAYKGVRSTALTRGVCVLCEDIYERGSVIVASWRQDGSEMVEERWHLLCWETYQATAIDPERDS